MKKIIVKIGITLLAIDSLLLGTISGVILIREPDATTVSGRHLYAGALANICLSLLLFLITIFPLRKGEKWAFWAFCLPVTTYGLPMIYLDAMNVVESHLFNTLMPQFIGITLASLGLSLIASWIFERGKEV